MRSQLVTRETSQEETFAADSNRQQKNIPAMSVTLEVSQLEHSIEANAEQPAKLQKKNVSNYAWQSAIILIRAASFSACADCHALFLS